MSLVSFYNVSLTLKNNPILDQVNWHIQAQDRIALVGRNGAGKSTLLRLLQGELVVDSGQITQQNNLRIASLMQEVPLDVEESVYHFLVKSLGDVGEALTQFFYASISNDLESLALCQQEIDRLHAWEVIPRVEMMASRLGLNPSDQMTNLSGGMKRRALLAAALIAEPDLLLLDEPTNHLDINTIEWLESYLKNYSGSLLVVTHDREFLKQIANQIVEIDRGQLFSHTCDYETYLDRRETQRLSEQKQNELFDKRLSEEETWIRTGVKARRTRNEGRVRALKAMREQHKARREQLSTMKSLNIDGTRSGSLVIEAKHLCYQLHDKQLLDNFSLLLTRGDKIGIIGANGCGKTTLVRLLLGELNPNSGTVRQGTSLQIAYFDQLRRQLEEHQTLMANVADGADFVTIEGKSKHVSTYLRDFLFSPEQFNQPVSTLSGGERNRLLLAKLFAKPVNLLVMDEPTNDLDIETLELLETLLVDYTGSLLLISHDRAFINQITTSVLVHEGNGIFNEYLGGYEDYQNQKKISRETSGTKSHKRVNTNKLSFNEQRELSQLPQKIEVLEQEIEAMQLKMTEPDFYQQDPQHISHYTQQLEHHEKELSALYERWEKLEHKDH